MNSETPDGLGVIVFSDSDEEHSAEEHPAEERAAKKPKIRNATNQDIANAEIGLKNMRYSIGYQNTARSDESNTKSLPDGGKEKTYADGTKETIYPDKTQKINYRSGRKLIFWSNGIEERQYPSGRIEKVYPKKHPIEYETKDEYGNELKMMRTGDYEYKMIDGYTQIKKNGQVTIFRHVDDDSGAASAAAAHQKKTDNESRVARKKTDFVPISAMTLKFYATSAPIKRRDRTVFEGGKPMQGDFKVVRVLVDRLNFPRAVEWQGRRLADNKKEWITVWIACTLEIWAQKIKGSNNRVVITTVNESTDEDRKNTLWVTIVKTIENSEDPIKNISLKRVVPEVVDERWQKDDSQNPGEPPFMVKNEFLKVKTIVFETITEPYKCLWLPRRQDPQEKKDDIFSILNKIK